MRGLTSAVHWWEEWQLRVLVLSSLVIQFLLFIFSFLRRAALPGWFRFITWLAYLGGDAVAIYALATLFNRHKAGEDGRGGGGSTELEVVWAPILLLHLGGHDGCTAYNIEDNELWSRHLLTAVSQVTVAIYVFCKSWPLGGDKRLLQAAILLFVPGVVKCFVKPWALKTASIYSLVSSLPAASVKQNEGEMYLLKDYVKQARDFVQEQNDEGETTQVARASVDDEDRPRCNEEPGGTSTTIGAKLGQLMEDMGGAWVLVRGLLKSESDDGAPSQGNFFVRLSKRLNPQVSERVREMVQGRSEVSKLFVDLSSSYLRRLSILADFWGLKEERAYGRVRQGLTTAFLLLYTKVKTALHADSILLEVEGYEIFTLKYHLRMWIQLSRMILPWASIGLFHRSNREVYNDIDVKITYAIFCSAAVLETCSNLSLVLTGEISEEWPEMVAQYSFIGYFARNRKHSKKIWVVGLLGCKDFLDQHWCMKSCFSSARISELVLRYLKDGWTEKIQDAASYRRFNDHHSSEGLSLSIKSEKPLLFDESVLLWHIATDFCFFSSSCAEHRHRCAFAKVPMWTKRLPALFSRSERFSGLVTFVTSSLQVKLGLLIPGRIKRIGEMILKYRTSLLTENDQTTSQCGQELTDCKAVLCRQMSNYMVYLLFVNPEMLSPGSRRNLFTTAHQKLQGIFKGDNQTPLDNKRELTLKIISKLESSSEATTSGTLIHEAWTLAQKLQSLGDEKMWEVIQGVWVEKLCYSAGRCRGYLHAKALGKGGEFLSYVWLLMFYMGMETFTDKLQREDLPSHEAGNNAATAPTSTSEWVSSTTGAGAAPSTSSEVHTASAGTAAPSTTEIRVAEDDGIV